MKKTILAILSVVVLVMLAAQTIAQDNAQSYNLLVPSGYEITKHVTDLAAPSMITFDDQDRMIVAETGVGDSGTAKITRIQSDGTKTVLADESDFGNQLPIAGVAFHDGHIYVSHAGTISMIDENGAVQNIITDLPGTGDHQTNQMVFKDGRIYFTIGSVTNSGVVGVDNEWITTNPDLHEVPCEDITLTQDNVFTSPNPLTPDENDTVQTSPYTPFGQTRPAGTTINSSVKCNGALMSANMDGSDLRVEAWGFRNPYGLEMNNNAELYVTMHGSDDRGSRPIYDALDCMYKIEDGAWYGWPDFNCGNPITDSRYQTDDGYQPQFIIANHPTENPPQPAAIFEPHEAVNGFAFAPERWGENNTAYVALFGDFAPRTGDVPEPRGYKIVKVNIANGNVEDFIKNEQPGSAFLNNATGFEHVSDVTFGPDGNMYITDWGVAYATEQGLEFQENSGVVWKVIKQDISEQPNIADPDFRATLTGEQEIPPVNTSGHGQAIAVLDGDILKVKGSFQDLESDVMPVQGNPAHIHLGEPGENGPIVFPLIVNASQDMRSGTFWLQSAKLNSSQIQDLQNEDYYINVHTVEHPSGEIRGQLLLIDDKNDTNNTQQMHYRVTIDNMASGQPISPIVVATHQQNINMFEVGENASNQIQEIAENGNQHPMVDLLKGMQDVTDVVDVGRPLARDGQTTNNFTDSVTVHIMAHDNDMISLAGMLICTNDGFTGLNAVELPDSGVRTYFTAAYDSGSENNTEQSSDVVDPCSVLGPIQLPGDPNGNENAAVETQMPIQMHPGIAQVGDLTQQHEWPEQVLMVTIERIIDQDDDDDGNNTGNNTDDENDGNQNGNVTDGANLIIKEWYPKQNHFVFVCETPGMNPVSYDWFYGDGQKLIGISNRDTYHIYDNTGQYTVTCQATDGTRTIQDSITVNVDDIFDGNPDNNVCPATDADMNNDGSVDYCDVARIAQDWTGNVPADITAAAAKCNQDLATQEQDEDNSDNSLDNSSMNNTDDNTSSNDSEDNSTAPLSQRADFDNDGDIDEDDEQQLVDSFGNCDECNEDLNNDGTVDQDDLSLLLENKSSDPIDAVEDLNNDGYVDQADLDIIDDYLGEVDEDEPLSVASDLNEDGEVDTLDEAMVVAAWHTR